MLIWIFPALYFANHDVPIQLDLALSTPSRHHPWGCEAFGRDVLMATLAGAGSSLLFAALATLLSATLAILFVASAKTWSHQAGDFLDRAIDFVLSFPTLLVSLAIVAFLKPSPATLIFALVLGSSPSLARLLSARADEVLAEAFVEAARGLGGHPLHIARRHLAPHLSGLVAIKIPAMLAGAILAEASLSFLGVGLPQGEPSWGALLLNAKDYLIEAPHLMFFTGLPLFITILILQLWGEALTRRQQNR